MKLLDKLRNLGKPDSNLTHSNPVAAKLNKNIKLNSSAQIERSLQLAADDIESGRHKILLYRFLTDNIPAVNASVWTWVRMAAAAGEYRVEGDERESETARGQQRLEKLHQGLVVTTRTVGDPDDDNQFFIGTERDTQK